MGTPALKSNSNSTVTLSYDYEYVWGPVEVEDLRLDSVFSLPVRVSMQSNWDAPLNIEDISTHLLLV